jgi:hypothetical protein
MTTGSALNLATLVLETQDVKQRRWSVWQGFGRIVRRNCAIMSQWQTPTANTLLEGPAYPSFATSLEAHCTPAPRSVLAPPRAVLPVASLVPVQSVARWPPHHRPDPVPPAPRRPPSSGVDTPPLARAPSPTPGPSRPCRPPSPLWMSTILGFCKLYFKFE